MSSPRSASARALFVVELDHGGRVAQIMDLPDQAGAHDGLAVLQIDEGVVDRAMIGAVEGQDFPAAR